MPRPFFWKLILPSTLQPKKLRIPDNFVGKVKDELSVAAALTVPDGHVWRIGLRKAGNKIWFQEGWQAFVERSPIRGKLYVKYCNVQAGRHNPFEELEDDDKYPLAPQNLLLEAKVNNSINWAGEDNLCASNDEALPKPKKRGRKKQKSDPTQQGDGTDMHARFYESASVRKRTVTAEERERTMNLAKAFEPTNPFCRVVLRPSYLYKGCIMYLPSCFAERCGVSGFIKLQLPDGREWPVRCRYGGGKAKLSQGWYEFTLENNLGEGDVCVLEMLDSRELILRVTVFRILES